ncbi:hypothetical protein VP01_1328g1 [Puccinia sorghi]|uniref:Uncharacterized protein n=1 Tax=Puccinia sorghi TaxID=27349 RepID=A0A0L6VMH8_9BASI|nr:hypothetical protein VP01_1328g1 [Puccinia sorghi]
MVSWILDDAPDKVADYSGLSARFSIGVEPIKQTTQRGNCPQPDSINLSEEYYKGAISWPTDSFVNYSSSSSRCSPISLTISTIAAQFLPSKREIAEDRAANNKMTRRIVESDKQMVHLSTIPQRHSKSVI